MHEEHSGLRLRFLEALTQFMAIRWSARLRRPTPPNLVRGIGMMVVLAAIYFAAGKLGLRLAFFHPSATPVWAPTGIALSAFLILGPRAWPGIFAGAFLVNLTTAGTVLTSLGIAVGNTLEGVVGAYLVTRWAGGRGAFDSARSLTRFAVLAAAVSTTVSATIGVITLAVAGFARWADFGSIWATWWLGDAAGDLIVAPLLLLWIAQRRIGWRPGRALEATVALAALTLSGLIVFGELSPVAMHNYPLQFMCIPPLLWLAMRFGAREVATGVFLLSAIAIRGTLIGFGPFVRVTANESLVLLQAFMAVVAVTSLILAAVVSDRRRVEEELRRLSVHDPLTGLANYRRLITVLEGEIRRSQRNRRPFALLFLDLDGLKEINDRHGHVVGSRAICRLADVLRASCRASDTAARFGGDEFVVVLPETDERAAWEAAHRISARVAVEPQRPPLWASLGVALYPRDGTTAEALLGSADRLLYAAKAKRHPRRRRAVEASTDAPVAGLAGLGPLFESS